MINSNTDLSQDSDVGNVNMIMPANKDNQALRDKQSMARHDQSIHLRKVSSYIAMGSALFLVFFSLVFFSNLLDGHGVNSEFIPYAMGFILSMLIAGVTTIVVIVKSSFKEDGKEDISTMQSVPSISVIKDFIQTIIDAFSKK
jgi:hypothetical protein